MNKKIIYIASIVLLVFGGVFLQDKFNQDKNTDYSNTELCYGEIIEIDEKNIKVITEDEEAYNFAIGKTVHIIKEGAEIDRSELAVGDNVWVEFLEEKALSIVLDIASYYGIIVEIGTSSIDTRLPEEKEISCGLSIRENTKIIKDGKEIELSELAVGDGILVTYTGGILESFPAQIHQVISIEVQETK